MTPNKKTIRNAWCIAKIALVSCLLAFPALANQRPTSHGGDGRLLHFHYTENEVFHVDVNFRYITMIRFETGEMVNAIQIGDSESFQVNRLNRGDVISVKPLIGNARTNMNIITSKRIYSFFIEAGNDGPEEGENFRIYFKYGEDPDHGSTFVEQTSGTVATGERVNTDYQIAGKTDFAPLQVYDDGVNTWLRYRPTARRPAVFETNAKGEEAVINYTAHPDHLIQLHGLSAFWTLRIGDEIVCIRKRPQS